MFVVQAGIGRVAFVFSLAKRLCAATALAGAVAAGGCAENQTRYDAAQHVRAIPPQVAEAQQQQLEDDGLPPQVPPPLRTKPDADDPSEPYSPNYGKSLPQRRADAGVAAIPQ